MQASGVSGFMIIWLASYPRSGNTLLRIILNAVFERQTYSKHDDAEDIGADANLTAEVGHQFLGESWPAAYDRMRGGEPTFLVKTHDAPEDDARAIYIVRDGRSACRSFFHYLKDFPRLDDTFALRDVIAGFTAFGSWGDHLDAWRPNDRPGTLLLKYEDLIADPHRQIERIAEFTGLTPLHDWQNDFDRLHALSPQFFRAGAKNNAATALDGPDLDLFWAQHGDWMRRLDYPAGPDVTPAEAAVDLRRYLSDKGRAFVNLQERVLLAEQHWPADLPGDSDVPRLRTAVMRAHHAEAVANDARTAADAKAAEAAAALERAHVETESARGELADFQRSVAVQTAHADGRMMESRALFAHQLTMANEAAAAARADVAAAVAAANRRVAEVTAAADAKIAAAESQADRHRDRRLESVRRLRAERRDAAAARTQAIEAVAQAERFRQEMAALDGRISAATTAYRDAIRRIEESGREAYIAQKQYAASLQEKNKVLATLTAAVGELDHRLRVLLTSRFLRAGWHLGFGAVPYWADSSKDELTALLDGVRKSNADDPGSASVLRRLVGLVDRSASDGTDMELAVGHLVEKGFKPSAVLDIGSGKGYWSVMASLRWPEARFTMIDPLPESEPELISTCRDPRFKYLLLAVGSEPGDAVMNLTPDSDGSSILGPPDPDPSHRLTVPVQTLDRLIESGAVEPPQLVKLDVQGFELRVLDGGQKLFDTTDVFVIESNLFEFMPGCPRMHELIDYMAGRGFYPFDFAGLLRRPFENDLGQVDIVFVRGRHPMVQNIQWVTLDSPSPGTPGEGRGEGDLVSETGLADRNHPNPFPGYRERGPKAPRPKPVVSVVICTRNPRWPILDRTLDSLENQTLPRDRFELIVVDNNSTPPLTIDRLNGTRRVKAKLVTEPVDGLSYARCAGIAAAAGELFVFVDDDNFLAPDYLEKAVEIAKGEARVGLFGGISEVELESPMAAWKAPVLPYLGIRDHGPEPITEYADHWGEWEPIGAGMVARREVAEKFVQMFRASPDAKQLGRRGSALLSGEDSLFARAAHRVGYACSYQPSLRLTHYIKKSRLKVRYLARLLQGHGRSYVLLHRTLGKPTEPLKLRTAVARLGYRIKTKGAAGVLTWFWDLGYSAEKRKEPAPPKPPVPDAIPVPAEGAGHGV
jgi:FkbM family methyltransferase